MSKNVLILIMSIAICSIAMAQTAIQTDWSGGPGISGPVYNWGNTFDMENGVDWYSSTGELNLDFSLPMEHLITGGYVRVNHALPVDVDGDGDTDVLAAAGRYGPPYFFTGSIYWWENTDGFGNTWEYHVVDNSFPSAPSICSADLDGDGDTDIIGASRGTVNDMAWWENVDGQGTVWTQHIIPSSIQQGSAVDTADVNNDGYVDILCTDTGDEVVWMENVDGSGDNWTEHTIGYCNVPNDVYGTDVDGDEDIDVIAPAYNGDYIRWFENVDGSGINWDDHDVASDFNGARSVFAGDIDGDGDTDILGAASLAWEITWWENYGGTGDSWIEHVINSNFNWAFAVYAADMDEDGDTDVLGAAYFGDDITWWENTDGSGLNWYEHLVEGNFDGATDVAAADMDGDGDPDIIGAAHEDADISWWNVTCCIGASELVSSILDTEAGVEWDSINWNSTEPVGTSIYFQVRSSTDPLYMGSWSSDITSPGSLGNYLNNGDQYVQYRVLLESDDPDLSPVLEDVTLSWDLLAPISDFSGTPTTGYAPLDVQFTDLSVQGAYPITSWVWDFGDGNTSTDQNPIHTYTSPGDYTVMLTVSDDTLSDTETKEDYISVNAVVAPTADFSATPTAGYAPLEVQFADLSVQGTYSIINWSWDFGDGNTSTDQNPVHIYESPGDYTVMLTVSDGTLSDTEIKTDYIAVSAGPPAADFSGDPTIGYAPLEVQFTDLSIQGTYPITVWSWYFGDGNMSTEQNPMHTYTSAGDYTVMLTVSDGTLSDTEIKTEYISVSQAGAPMADFSADPLFGTVPLPVQFQDESTQGALPITDWNWNFGDGNTSTDQDPQHTYIAKGIYTVILTVSDGTLTDTETKIDYITVYDTLIVDAGPDQSIPAGSSTTLEGSYTGGSGDVEIIWTPDSMIVQQGILNPQTLTITQNTTFYLTVTDLLTGENVIDSLRIEVFLGIEDIIRREGIHLYPNPFTDHITLSFDLPVKEKTILEIFNISGCMLLRQEIHAGERLIHITGLNNLPGGIYMVSIKNNALNKIKKLIH